MSTPSRAEKDPGKTARPTVRSLMKDSPDGGHVGVNEQRYSLGARPNRCVVHLWQTENWAIASIVRMRDLRGRPHGCLLYTSDAADDLLCVDLGGRRIIK